MPLVKVQHKGQMTIPRRIRSLFGLADGDVVEVKADGGRIIITPRPVTGDDEYTPEQRRIIDAGLAEGLEDIRQGRTYGPFDTHAAMMDSLQANSKKSKLKLGKRSRR